MTYEPKTLTELEAFWTSHGGTPLGIVGDARHVVGYHCGRDRIYGPNGLGDRDYSVQLERDKRGLTDGAAAIDLGKLDGTLEALRMFSSWLVATLTSSPAARADYREVIYSPDGVRVQRYSAIDNQIHTGAGNGDDSHLTHTHVSFLRDAEDRDKVAVWRPYFEDPDMPGLQFRFVDRISGIATVVGDDHALIRVHDAGFVPIPAGQRREVAGTVELTAPIDGHPGIPVGTKARLVGNVPGATPDQSIAAVLLVSDSSFEPDPAQTCDAWEAWYALAPKGGA